MDERLAGEYARTEAWRIIRSPVNQANIYRKLLYDLIYVKLQIRLEGGSATISHWKGGECVHRPVPTWWRCPSPWIHTAGIVQISQVSVGVFQQSNQIDTNRPPIPYRSTVIQQRTSALGAIGGILSIYNQGYYDNILELPISKIFFLLRYAFDDNAPAMLEASSKGLSILLYNQSDEILLDLTFDCSNDVIEPTLQITGGNCYNDTQADLDAEFAKMNLKGNQAFQTNISDDDENSVSSMNDFHLAETDLIKCLLRTNILQRIRFVQRKMK